ncbi:MAG TPA: hypothetical protein VI316_01830 [Candidatus Dormibacteraeota bacterium]
MMVALLAVELAALTAVDRAVADARALRAGRHYPEAIAEDLATAGRSGPLYLLAAGTTGQAATEAQSTLLDWAGALAAAGRVDQALDVARRVVAPDLLPAARRLRAQIALDDVRRLGAAGRFEDALRRVDQLRAAEPPADLAAQGEQLRPGLEVDAARERLTTSNGAVAALTYLDDALRRSPAGAAANDAQQALPGALLAAGRQRSAAGNPEQARALLRRCVDSYRRTPQAQLAAALLAAPVPVSGTLLRRDGTAVGGALVRLAGGYRRLGASGFALTGPFLTARTDGGGAFRIDRVPVGVPLVFEFLDQQGWELIVDDSRNPLYRVEAAALTPDDMGFVREP